jgi:hypothetical protein
MSLQRSSFPDNDLRITKVDDLSGSISNFKEVISEELEESGRMHAITERNDKGSWYTAVDDVDVLEII